MDAPTHIAMNTSRDNDHLPSEGFTLLATTLLTIYVIAIAIVGSLGNALTVYSVIAVKSLRKPSNALVAALALADMVTVSFSVPIVYSRNFYKDFYAEHLSVCHGVFYVMLSCLIASVNFHQVIAANRYVMITRPRHVYKRYWGRLGTGLAIGAVWVYSVVIVCLPVFGVGEVEYVPEFGGCTISENGSGLSWWYKTFFVLNVFESCGIVSPTFFLLTFRKIRAIKRRVGHAALGLPPAPSGSKKSPEGLSRGELAIVKMTVVTFLCFVCAWSPYMAFHVATIGSQKPGGLNTFFIIFALSSSVFNPLIYAGMNKNFRRSFSLTRRLRNSGTGDVTASTVVSVVQ